MEAVVIDFYAFFLFVFDFRQILSDPGPEGWPARGGLWRPVARCGRIFLAFQDDAIRQPALCSNGWFDSAGSQGIAAMAGWSLHDWGMQGDC